MTDSTESTDPFLKWAQENTDLVPSPEPEPDPEPFDAERFWADIEAQRAQAPSLSSGAWVRTLAICTAMLAIIMMATMVAVWRGVQDLEIPPVEVPPVEIGTPVIEVPPVEVDMPEVYVYGLDDLRTTEITNPFAEIPGYEELPEGVCNPYEGECDD